ncbi:hypothetical protein [Leptolyngbya sp. KIOST-1]|uniref:hypothetical protein n=1 Tax=Leptolyngbya sp. KIOST-1 TaxID=1229172 RepID=UPI00056B9310|nr:hypothetical protein [Leptolyngbya sp. KIOST-1]
MLPFQYLINRSGIGLWLPLALLGGGLGLGGWAWTRHYLGVAGRAVEPLVLVPNAAQTDGILSIRATLRGDRPFTRVEVIVVEPVPRTLDFYLPEQTPAAIEAAMAQRLRVPETTIRRLIQYEARPPEPRSSFDRKPFG